MQALQFSFRFPIMVASEDATGIYSVSKDRIIGYNLVLHPRLNSYYFDLGSWLKFGTK